MNHRFDLLQFFEGNVAQDAVTSSVLLPGGLLPLADGAAVGQHLLTSRAAGMETAAARRVEGAGHVAAQANLFLLCFRISNGHRR